MIIERMFFNKIIYRQSQMCRSLNSKTNFLLTLKLVFGEIT